MGAGLYDKSSDDRGNEGGGWEHVFGNALKDVFSFGSFGRERNERRAQDAIDAEQARLDKLAKDEQLQKYNEDVSASRSAAAIRDTASSKTSGPAAGSGAVPINQGQKLGADEQDVLGV